MVSNDWKKPGAVGSNDWKVSAAGWPGSGLWMPAACFF